MHSHNRPNRPDLIPQDTSFRVRDVAQSIALTKQLDNSSFESAQTSPLRMWSALFSCSQLGALGLRAGGCCRGSAISQHRGIKFDCGVQQWKKTPKQKQVSHLYQCASERQ
ncbi:hypothetical protein AMECASPLE_009874 [Ameca splendens]|uniref:Uncharacterized protein n=1 Tax=Ameca splendens TaxID=208324 RepID=A0ABV0ZW97_9TELE